MSVHRSVVMLMRKKLAETYRIPPRTSRAQLGFQFAGAVPSGFRVGGLTTPPLKILGTVVAFPQTLLIIGNPTVWAWPAAAEPPTNRMEVTRERAIERNGFMASPRRGGKLGSEASHHPQRRDAPVTRNGTTVITDTL